VTKTPILPAPCRLKISDEDVLAAMKRIPGYIDITPGDFKEIYALAFELATERLSGSLTAADVMTRHIVFVTLDTPLAEAAGTMARHGISGVPVLDSDGKVAGIISEKDFLAQMGGAPLQSFMDVVTQCLKNKGCLALSLRNQRAADIMRAPVIAVEPHTPVNEISRLFVEKAINRVPVLDSTLRPVGIVSRGDLVRSSCVL
jgi:CBS domain-containing membrane protein